MLLKASTFLPGPGPLMTEPRENISAAQVVAIKRYLASLGVGR